MNLFKNLKNKKFVILFIVLMVAFIIVSSRLLNKSENNPSKTLEFIKCRSKSLSQRDNIDKLIKLLPMPSKCEISDIKIEEKAGKKIMISYKSTSNSFNDEDTLYRNSAILFSLINELLDVEMNVDVVFKNVQFQKSRRNIESELKIDLRPFARSEESFNMLLKNLFSKGFKKMPLKSFDLYVWKNPNLMGDDNIYYTLLEASDSDRLWDSVYNKLWAIKDLNEVKQKLEENKEELFVFINQTSLADLTEEDMENVKDSIKVLNNKSYVESTICFWKESVYADVFQIEDAIRKSIKSPEVSYNELEKIIKLDKVAYDYLIEEKVKGENLSESRTKVVDKICLKILGPPYNNKWLRYNYAKEFFQSIMPYKPTKLKDPQYDGTDEIERIVSYECLKRKPDIYIYFNKPKFTKDISFTLLTTKIIDTIAEYDEIKIFSYGIYEDFALYNKDLITSITIKEEIGLIPITLLYMTVLSKDAYGKFILKEFKAIGPNSFSDFTTPVTKTPVEGIDKKIINSMNEINLPLYNVNKVKRLAKYFDSIGMKGIVLRNWLHDNLININ